MLSAVRGHVFGGRCPCSEDQCAGEQCNHVMCGPGEYCCNESCSNNRLVDTPEVVVDLSLVVQFVQKRGDDADPSTIAAPTVEAVVRRFARARSASGRSRQGAPVCKIQRMPLTMARWSLGGRPKSGPSGEQGAIRAHCGRQKAHSGAWVVSRDEVSSWLSSVHPYSIHPFNFQTEPSSSVCARTASRCVKKSVVTRAAPSIPPMMRLSVIRLIRPLRFIRSVGRLERPDRPPRCVIGRIADPDRPQQAWARTRYSERQDQVESPGSQRTRDACPVIPQPERASTSDTAVIRSDLAHQQQVDPVSLLPCLDERPERDEAQRQEADQSDDPRPAQVGDGGR